MYHRETKLFEFSRDMNRKELKIRKMDVTLQWLQSTRARLRITMAVWLCSF